jgi:tetratricopeptide (TPR) repeat protein
MRAKYRPVGCRSRSYKMLTLAFWILVSSNELGAAAFARGQFALAEHLFTLAWDLAPAPNIASNRGAVARRLGKPAEAEHWFDTVYTLRRQRLGDAHPDTVMALNNRAVARAALGRLREARADYQQALSLVHPGSADHAAILANLGDLAFEQARLHEARTLCAQALALNARAQCQQRLERVSVDARTR